MTAWAVILGAAMLLSPLVVTFGLVWLMIHAMRCGWGH